LAETASVFGEMLTFQELLNRETNKKRRQLLIASKVEDMLNTVMRQIAFCEFERMVHDAERKKGELSVARIGEIWMQVFRRESLRAIPLSSHPEYQRVLDVYPAFHPLTVLCLCLRVR
jgi:oligoendopeptidase F